VGRGGEYAPFQRYPQQRVDQHLSQVRQEEAAGEWLQQSCNKETQLQQLHASFLARRVAERISQQADLRARLTAQVCRV
jgi:hypothetical protein